VLVDLTVAIGVGVGLAAILFMIQMSKSIELSYDENVDEQDQRTVLPEGVEVFKISGPVFFGVAGDLLDTLQRMGQMPKVLIVRMLLVPYLDATGVSALEAFVKKCRSSGTEVVFSGVQAQPRKIMSRSHIGHAGMEAHFAQSYGEAIGLASRIAEPA
jgi:SulP family sulfate permease